MRVSDRSQTIPALPTIMAGFRFQGYRFVTIPEPLDVACAEVFFYNLKGFDILVDSSCLFGSGTEVIWEHHLED
jgi:hypothetical protein